jgi:hypothetical protein
MPMAEPMARAVPMMDAIVLLAVAFAVVFLVAWFVSPRLRAWVERPKYRFQADVRSYDEAQRSRRALEGRNTRK